MKSSYLLDTHWKNGPSSKSPTSFSIVASNISSPHTPCMIQSIFILGKPSQRCIKNASSEYINVENWRLWPIINIILNTPHVQCDVFFSIEKLFDNMAWFNVGRSCYVLLLVFYLFDPPSPTLVIISLEIGDYETSINFLLIFKFSTLMPLYHIDEVLNGCANSIKQGPMSSDRRS